MSERVERRERRRKWVILGLAVAVPLLLMAGLAGFATLARMKDEGSLPDWFPAFPKLRKPSKPTVNVEPETFEPESVESFQTDDIVYSQLDRNGFVTSISHFFRELGPDPESPDKPFTVNRKDEYDGHIVLYRLRNVGTGEIFEFENVPVKRLAGGGWVISEDGWRQIRDQLQARMRVQIRRIRSR
jgi:hypothetical protein